MVAGSIRGRSIEISLDDHRVLHEECGEEDAPIDEVSGIPTTTALAVVKESKLYLSAGGKGNLDICSK